MVREGAENDLLVRQCTFVHAAAYCHTRDATKRCQFSEFQSEYFPSGLPVFLDYLHTLFPVCIHARIRRLETGRFFVEDGKENIRTEIRELTPLSCMARMTICCSVHKSALDAHGDHFQHLL